MKSALFLLFCLLLSFQTYSNGYPLDPLKVANTVVTNNKVENITDLSVEQVEQVSFILETLLYSWRDPEDALTRLTNLIKSNIQDESKQQKAINMIKNLVDFMLWLNGRMQYPDISVNIRQAYETLVALLCDKTFIKMSNNEKLTSMMNTISSFNLSADDMAKVKLLIEKDCLSRAQELGLMSMDSIL